MDEQDKNNNSFGNDNNTYDSGVSIGENGEYCYIYSPNKKKTKVKTTSKAFTVFAICAIVMSLLIAASSIGFALSIKDSIDRSSTGDVEDADVAGEGLYSSGDISQNEQNTLLNANVSIDKIESTGKNGYTSAGLPLSDISTVYKNVSSSVVEISTKVQMGYYMAAGEGSGVIIDDTGYIVTNYHVIDSASSIKVKLTDGDEYDASVVGTYESGDLAVIKISPDGKKLNKAIIGSSDDLVVGEQVLAIGNPLGSLGGSATAGIISATERNINVNGTVMTLIQTNAAINPGNSGGGLFNMAGQLIGVVNAKISDEEVEGIGFPIPSDLMYDIVVDIIKYGYVTGIADHGFSLLDVSSMSMAARYGLDSTGVYVLESKYNTEILKGDRIYSINSSPVSSTSDVNTIILNCSVGDTVEIVIVRGKKKYTYNITLKEYVPENVSFN